MYFGNTILSAPNPVREIQSLLLGLNSEPRGLPFSSFSLGHRGQGQPQASSQALPEMLPVGEPSLSWLDDELRGDRTSKPGVGVKRRRVCLGHATCSIGKRALLGERTSDLGKGRAADVHVAQDVPPV